MKLILILTMLLGVIHPASTGTKTKKDFPVCNPSHFTFKSYDDNKCKKVSKDQATAKYSKYVKKITEKSICVPRGKKGFVKIDCEMEGDELEELEWEFFSDDKCKKEVKIEGKKKVKAEPDSKGCSPHPFLEGKFTNFKYVKPMSIWMIFGVCFCLCVCVCILIACGALSNKKTKDEEEPLKDNDGE